MWIKNDHVLQFKITLKGTKPPIWRRIQILSDSSFWGLHIAVQDAMGWLDSHLHEFTVVTPPSRMPLRIGIPDEDDISTFPGSREIPDVIPGWDLPVSAFLNLVVRKADYIYDFGDGWEHAVLLEKILPREKDVAYPRCLGGRRACPPENCGGVGGYEALLAILEKPNHPEYEETRAWVGEDFQPDRFDKKEIEFDDPAARWDFAFGVEPDKPVTPSHLRLVDGDG